MDAALGTTLELRDCRSLSASVITCVAARSDALTEIAGVDPEPDRWTLHFAEGQVTKWTMRVGTTATPYQLLTVAPFTAWLAEAHPEIPNPYPLTGGVSHWLRDVDIVDQMPTLLAEYAAAQTE